MTVYCGSRPRVKSQIPDQASSQRRGRLALQPAEQEQYQHDHEEYADDSAWAVTPAARMRPYRDYTNQRQDEEDKKDSADAHGVHL